MSWLQKGQGEAMRMWGLSIRSREKEDVKANFMTFLQTTFGGERGVCERQRRIRREKMHRGQEEP